MLARLCKGIVLCRSEQLRSGRAPIPYASSCASISVEVRRMKRKRLRVAGLSLALLFAVFVASEQAGAAKPQSNNGGVKVIRPHDNVVALALDRNRVAYALGGKVSVWNLGTGKRTVVSGRQTAGDGNVVGLALAGSQVAWPMNAFGNSESDDYLFRSSVLEPKERLIAKAFRFGDACGAATGPGPCVGPWIGGVVASGNRILVNRWRTNSSGAITHSGLYALDGTRFKPVATGPGTVEAVAADAKHIAVLHPDGSIGLYSAAGKPRSSVTPKAKAEEIALSGRNLVVLEPKGQLALYDATSGSLRKNFTLRGHPELLWQGANFCRVQCNIAVKGNIAVYSTPVRSNARQVITESAVRALNLSNGRDHSIGRLPGQINLTRINSAGLVYTNNNWTEKHGYQNKLVFVPFKQVAATVS